MSFNSVAYLVFLVLVVAAVRLLGHRGQNRLLLAASYFFYAWWDVRFLLLIVLSSVVDFFCALMIDRGRVTSRERWTCGLWAVGAACLCVAVDWSALAQAGPLALLDPGRWLSLPFGAAVTAAVTGSMLLGGVLARPGETLPEPRRRRAFAALSLVSNLGLLGAFKYFDFFVSSAEAAAASLGFELPGSQLIDRLMGRKPDPMLSQAPTVAPRTSFNDRITPHRRFAFGSLDLADVKDIKKQLGVTVNDVVLALCASALRRYLQERGELPADPLIAMVPVSVRTEAQQGSFGNQVSAMTTSLHTHVTDPVQRLECIHESMRIAKEQHQALPANLLQDFAQFAPPAVAARAARVIARATAANWMDVPFNVVISNVPGPQFPIYGLGAKLVAHYPVSAINDGVGLNITVQSYDGSLDFGIIACRELMPDVWDLMDDLREALRELKQAAKLAVRAD